MIWPDGFTLHDDLTLLEAIEALGFGNWDAIKVYMLRPEDEPVEVLVKHYFYIYGENGLLSRQTGPLVPHPNMSSIRTAGIQDPAKCRYELVAEEIKKFEEREKLARDAAQDKSEKKEAEKPTPSSPPPSSTGTKVSP